MSSRYYYEANHGLITQNLNQVQDEDSTATTNLSLLVANCHAQQLASPPLEQQEDIVWYNHENSFYHQQHQQISNDLNIFSSTFGPNQTPNPQKLVLFNLLHNQQQDYQQICYHDNHLIQYDEPASSLNEWVLVNDTNCVLPASPMSMQSADNFDSSPIMGGSSFTHCMYSQPVLSTANNLAPDRQYYHHRLIFNNSFADMFASDSNKCTQHQHQSQEIAQYQHQQQQYQYQQQQQQQQQQQPKQQPKQHKKTTRRRASRSQLQCTTCLKTFSRPYNLKSHQRTHTKERPFLCLHPDCGWTFARPHDLKRHELLHSGVKPFECVCGKRFARSDAFKRHQSVDISCAISTMPQQRRSRRRSNNDDEYTH